MPHPPALTIRAGAAALATLRRDGSTPDTFSTLLGASGGPKWLVLPWIDRVLARRIVAGRATPLHALGTSIGAFRHTALALGDPEAALARFEDAYIGQAYETRPSPDHVTAESRRILGILLGEEGPAAALAHPSIRLHVGTVRSHGPVATERRALLLAGLGLAATANAVSRRALGMFFERVVFHATDEPAFLFGDLATANARLGAHNLEAATLASGSIPMVMAPLVDVAGAPPGLYRDGGVTDYHFAMDFEAPPGLVLFPHFFDRIVPGWFDKALPWRKPRGPLLDRTVFVAPSREFVASLPGAKVPDRDDFQTMPTAERQARWKRVVAECRRLGDELEDLLDRGRLGDAARPFEA